MTEPRITAMQFVVARGARKFAGEVLRGNLDHKEAAAVCIDWTMKTTKAIIARTRSNFSRAKMFGPMQAHFGSLYRAREILRQHSL